MKGKDISAVQIGETTSLREAMDLMDRLGSGVILITAQGGVLKGILTDGDVRRVLLKGCGMEEPASKHMNTSFASGAASKTREENIALMNERIRHLPVLDDEGRLVELLSWSEIWRLPVTQPLLGGNELNYVSDCITSNWISSQGAYIKRFEKMFADYHSVEHALTASSGTTALHLALAALGIGPGDEVIVPSLTFAACANVVMHTGATPVFADVSAETWTLDPALLEGLITPRTKAVMPVHLYGQPCDMDPILDVARRRGLYVVEDCAESLGAKYKGALTGVLGHIGCFSFFANKVITTGEGGMCITRDKALAEKMLVLRDHGMSKKRKYWHELAGFNYRMTNVQAAIGVAQMEKIDKFLASRKALSTRYRENLSGAQGITLPPENGWSESIFWLYSILLDKAALGVTVDDMIKRLAVEGIETRPFFSPLHLQPPYPKSKAALPVTEMLSESGISLPTGNDVTANDADRVSEAIKKVLKNAGRI